MTAEAAIRQLRAMVSRQGDALDRVDLHSGIPWRETPLGRAATKLLEETDPERDEAQGQPDEAKV